MIYQTPKKTLFLYSDGWAWLSKNEAKRISEENLSKCKLISKADSFLVLELFKKVDVDEFLKIREQGEGDVFILDMMLNNVLDSFFERIAICEKDGELNKVQATSIAFEELVC